MKKKTLVQTILFLGSMIFIIMIITLAPRTKELIDSSSSEYSYNVQTLGVSSGVAIDKIVETWLSENPDKSLVRVLYVHKNRNIIIVSKN